LRTSTPAICTGAAVFAVATAAWPTLYSMGMQGGVPGLEQRLPVGTRLTHWATIIDAIGQRPWFGYGWGQVGVAQQQAALSHGASGEWLSFSHNVVLDLMVWSGVPIGGLVTLGCVYWLYAQVRSCRDAGTLMALSAIAALATHALLEYPLAYAYFLLPLGLLVGMQRIAPSATARSRPPSPRICRIARCFDCSLVFSQ
jgi:O-antigen ligase